MHGQPHPPVKGGAICARRLAAAAMVAASLMSAGCVMSPFEASAPDRIVERDLLAEAAADVEAAPWPAPQGRSLIQLIAGGEDSPRVTKDMAVTHYLNTISLDTISFDTTNGEPAATIFQDARAKLQEAQALVAVANLAAEAPRLSMHDVTLVENAIQRLRSHREIYFGAIDRVQDEAQRDHAAMDTETLDARRDALRDAFASAIRALSQAADGLARQIEDDRRSNYARPESAPQPDGAPL